MILPIVKVPAGVLTKKVKRITTINDKIRALARDMGQTLLVQKDPEGVGLAAPQVGEGVALFIIRPDKNSPIRTFINPKIIQVEDGKQVSAKKKTTLEGCLSIDRIWSPIQRPQRVLLSYQTIDGKEHEQWFEQFEAVIVQHEMDHLNGILFTQRAVEQKKKIYEEHDGELHEVKV